MMTRIGNAFIQILTALIIAAWCLLYGCGLAYSFDRVAEFGTFQKGVREIVLDRAEKDWVICSYSLATVPREAVQVDHLVPVSYAWTHGAGEWVPEQRRRFYNDIENLAPVLAGLNAQKGDKPPWDWMPPANREWYLAKWRAVCGKWKLNCDYERLQ